MAYDRQLKSNRLNATSSTGRRTPEGKTFSSRNSRTHGLLSKAVIIEGEFDRQFSSSLPRLNELHALRRKDLLGR